MLPASPLVMIVPNTAVPTVEPTLRKNWVDAVATPRSLRCEEFWMMRVKTCRAMPRPTPKTIIDSVRSSWLEP